jgi:hypothetical protein
MQALATSTDRPIFWSYPELVHRRFEHGEQISETALLLPVPTLVLVALAGLGGYALGCALSAH